MRFAQLAHLREDRQFFGGDPVTAVEVSVSDEQFPSARMVCLISMLWPSPPARLTSRISMTIFSSFLFDGALVHLQQAVESDRRLGRTRKLRSELARETPSDLRGPDGSLTGQRIAAHRKPAYART